MAYIANKPVRFDRNYQVGEQIPMEAIAPNMRKKLLDMGRILCVDIPEKKETKPDNLDIPKEDKADENTEALKTSGHTKSEKHPKSKDESA